MTAQYGKEFLDKIEEIRRLAKIRRQDEEIDHDKLQEVLKSLDDDNIISVARAFNQFLNLANIAEQAETTDDQMEYFPADSYLDEVFNKVIQAGLESRKNHRDYETNSL